MSGIGDYIHLNYANFKLYGIKKGSKETEKVDGEDLAEKCFDAHVKKEILEYKTNGETKDLLGIEDQLNYYFSAVKGDTKNNGGLTKEDIEAMQGAIKKFLGQKLQGVELDVTKLQSDILEGNLSVVDKYIDEELRNKLKKIGNSRLGATGTAYKANIQKKIDVLLELREALSEKGNSTQELCNKINTLEKKWQEIQQNLGSKKVKNENFINELNNLINTFNVGTAAIHGEYAEAIIVLVNYMLTKKAEETIITITEDLLFKVLKPENGTPENVQKVLGQERSKKALLSTHFNSEMVDIKKFEDPVYTLEKTKDGQDNLFSCRATQDKVDVTIDVQGAVNASVKNYDMSNMFHDVHFLSGRSLLQMIQEYENFTNYFLNIMASHPDEVPRNDLKQSAMNTMKITILSKALRGGAIIGENNEKQKEADLLIINDNSQGRFKVYSINQIINKLYSNNLEYLNIRGLNDIQDFEFKQDHFENSPKERITNLLLELHRKKLEVSLKKGFFANDF